MYPLTIRHELGSIRCEDPYVLLGKKTLFPQECRLMLGKSMMKTLADAIRDLGMLRGLVGLHNSVEVFGLIVVKLAEGLSPAEKGAPDYEEVHAAWLEANAEALFNAAYTLMQAAIDGDLEKGVRDATCIFMNDLLRSSPIGNTCGEIMRNVKGSITDTITKASARGNCAGLMLDIDVPKVVQDSVRAGELDLFPGTKISTMIGGSGKGKQCR
jgi:hypothetical protein